MYMHDVTTTNDNFAATHYYKTPMH